MSVDSFQLESNWVLEVQKDFYKLKKELTCVEQKAAELSIQNYIQVAEELPRIKAATSLLEQDEVINSVTGSRPEEGFSAIPITKRLELFATGYLKAKERGDLVGFFRCFSHRDPCLNGRTEGLNCYLAKLILDVELQDSPDYEAQLNFMAVIFSERVWKDLGGSMPSREEFTTYLFSHFDEVASDLRATASQESFKAFLSLMKDSRTYIPPKDEDLDWRQLLKNFIGSKYFNIAYERTKSFLF